MDARWYYEHDDNRSGPFSDQQLRDLADAGEILPTDTVWKQGVDKGVPASKVKNLFPAREEAATADTGPPDDSAVPPETSPPSPSDKPDTEGSSSDIAQELKESVYSSTYQTPPQPKQAPKLRAIAGQGAIIVGQDGVIVRIKKKCTECGTEDSCFHTIPIRKGRNKTTFFCRKCRKSRQIEFQGFVSGN